jgi:hypothetical protein
MLIFVKTPSKTTLSITFDPSKTISDLKSHIISIYNIIPSMLIFKGTTLKDHHTIEHYKITDQTPKPSEPTEPTEPTESTEPTEPTESHGVMGTSIWMLHKYNPLTDGNLKEFYMESLQIIRLKILHILNEYTHLFYNTLEYFHCHHHNESLRSKCIKYKMSKDFWRQKLIEIDNSIENCLKGDFDEDKIRGVFMD